MKTSSAQAIDARISLKHSVQLCKEIRGKKVERAEQLLRDLASSKRSLAGKHYTSASRKLLELLRNAEANAAQKGLNVEKLFVRAAKADKARGLIRPKSRWKSRGRRAKATSIKIILEER